MNCKSNLTVYKASAGSGKTFQLAVRYIAMLVRNPESYRGILAVTFTNKATAEMKQRILSQLYGIGHALESSDMYYKVICDLCPGIDGDAIRRNAGRALDLILQDYGHFRIETIDSFFQTVMRGLARELHLGAGLNIELDTSKAVSDAVDAFLDDIDPKSDECRQVMRFIEGNIDNDKDWNTRNSLKEFASELFSETFMEKAESLKDILSQPDAIDNYRENLTTARNTVLPPMVQKVQEYGKAIRDILQQNGSSIQELSRNIIGSVTRMCDGSFLDEGNISKTFTKCCAEGAAFFNKSLLSGKPYLEGIAQKDFCYRMEETAAILPEYQRLKNSFDAALQYLHELSLLMSVRRRIDAQNVEQSRFVLADTPSLLAGLQSGDTSFVFEKTGNFTRNIMIDEFQDTSRMQWRNLYLLLLECLSAGNDCLVVGDVKQSIYRWRNSDWNILNTGLESSLRDYAPVVVPMQDNYRSLEKVVDFNSRLFPEAQKSLQEYLTEETGDCFPALSTAYSDVKQNSKHKERCGFVHVETFVPDSKLAADSVEEVCRRIAETLDRLVGAGVSQSDIAMLFRYSREINAVATWFAENRPEYRMISAEAFRLDASAAVRMLVNALRWLSNQEDRIALTSLLWEWEQAVNGKTVKMDDVLQSDMEGTLPSGMRDMREQLRQMPLYELLERLYQLLQLGRVAGQDQYVMAFMDVAADWLRRNPGNIADFIAAWDDKLCGTTIPATDADGIRLVTIHKSKGLEYHTVIVPFCDWELTKYKNRLWVGTVGKSFSDDERLSVLSDMPVLPVAFSKGLGTSVFKDDCMDEVGQQAVDNLNLLYVALTRAVSNLIVTGRHISRQGENSVCRLLEKSLPGAFGVKAGDDGTVIYENGEICPHDDMKKKNTDNPFDIVPDSVGFSMCSYPMTAKFRQSGDSVRFAFQAQHDGETDIRSEYIERGKLLHNLFSAISVQADVDPVVERMLSDGLLDSRMQAEQLKTDIHGHIAASGVEKWFDGRYRLFNENSILFRDGGVMQTRRPDRVMITDDGTAVVVDFKFAQEREEYFHQVSEYMDLLRRMGMDKVEGYLWYVDSNKVIKVF